MKRAALLLVGLLVISGAALPGQEKGDAAVRAAIKKAIETFTEGAEKGDATLLASVYTTDAQALPANSEPIAGRAAIEKMWHSVLESGINTFELTTLEVESGGDFAYEVGSYVLKMKDGSTADRGKYVVIWKRVGGDWLMHRDIWTTSMPAKK